MSGFASNLKQASTTKTTATKKKKEKVFTPVADDVKKAIDALQMAKKAKKEAEAEINFHGGIIIKALNEIQDSDGFKGKFQSSYDIKGDTETAKFVATNKATVSLNDKESIEKLVGESGFAELFEERLTVSLKPEVLESDELQKEADSFLTPERIAKFFNVVSSLAIAQDYVENVYKHVDESKLAQLRTLVKQAKPSIR